MEALGDLVLVATGVTICATHLTVNINPSPQFYPDVLQHEVTVVKTIPLCLLARGIFVSLSPTLTADSYNYMFIAETDMGEAILVLSADQMLAFGIDLNDWLRYLCDPKRCVWTLAAARHIGKSGKDFSNVRNSN